MKFNLEPGSVQIFHRQPGVNYSNTHGHTVPSNASFDNLSKGVDTLIAINIQEISKLDIAQLQQVINEYIDEVKIIGKINAKKGKPVTLYADMAKKLLGKKGEINNFLSHTIDNEKCSNCGIFIRFLHMVRCPTKLPPIIEGGRRTLRDKRTHRTRRTRRTRR